MEARSFADDLKTSKQHTAAITTILLSAFSDAVAVETASGADDRAGADYWLVLTDGRRLAVDAKIRSVDYRQYGHDDLALETHSSIESNKPGWTLDAAKNTDYVLWYWPPTGRHCILPFARLRAAFAMHCDDWIGHYKTATTLTEHGNNQWHSQTVFVPTDTIRSAISNLQQK